MLFDSGKKLMAELLGRPLEPEEWFALIKKWDSGEVSNRQAAVYLNISEGWVCQLAGRGHLVRVRRGHVSLKSVEAWKASQNHGIDYPSTSPYISSSQPRSQVCRKKLGTRCSCCA